MSDLFYAKLDLLGWILESGEDLTKCAEECRKGESGFWRRTYYRTAFAHIEGSLNCLKRVILHDHERGLITLSVEQTLVLREVVPHVKDDGTVIGRQAFVDPIRTTRALFRMCQQLTPNFAPDYGDSGWDAFRKALIVRHRLTHPRGPSDLEISDEEFLSAKTALHWFSHALIEMHNLVAEKEKELEARTASSLDEA
jgi:hypothetical protein